MMKHRMNATENNFFTKAILFGLFLLFLNYQGYAQIDQDHAQQIRAELQQRELDEDELLTALELEGINLENLENASAEEILKIQQVIRMLEEKKSIKQKAFDLNADSTKNAYAFIPEMNVDTINIDSISTQSEIPASLFGHEMINQPSPKSGDNLIVNESYLLGPGDVLSISIWSENAIFDKSFTVNKQGYIDFDDASQKIFVKGLSFSKARDKIKARFSRYYQFEEGEYNISLESARKIRISIYGEVKAPGAYSFSATYNVIDGLRLTGGLNNNASVRNIRVIRPNGQIEIFDLYAYMGEKADFQNVFLQDGDIIHVPVAKHIVSAQGAIRRAARFEIKEGEGIQELISFSGGFSENANTHLVQLERFTLGEKEVFDVNLNEISKNTNFPLKNGDILLIRKIEEEAINFVLVKGEVINPGRFERVENMRVNDLLKLARLKASSKTDFAFLIRKKLDGTSTYIRLNLNDLISDPNHKDNLNLQNRDQLTIWSKERFIDDGTITVEGAIRFPGTYQYDYSEKLYLSDALILAGGLSRDASDIGVIHRSDPLRPNEKEYVRINLENLDTSYLSHENMVLEPFDRIEILSKNLFTERTIVKISGPVNHPGEFQYGENMTLKDLIILAGGFKLGASSKNIEISRVQIEENVSTRVSVAKIDLDPSLNVSSNPNQPFVLEPYDHVKVRFVPDFEFQNDVEIRGEVTYPGIYTLASKNERISDLIKKAGGLSAEAFSEGASLFRNEDSMGYIVVKLQEALKDEKSMYNFILKHGDIIEVPKMRDFVTIQGATKANEIYTEKMLKNPNGINVPFHESKNAMYYVKKYTGGIAENGSRREVYVEHPNGEIVKTRSYLFFHAYPNVRKGSVIRVGLKPEMSTEVTERKEVDWSKIIGDTLAQAMTIITLILLAKQASN